MLERQNPAECEAQYILAVMLERKRILKHRETQSAPEDRMTSGETGARRKILVYEHQQTCEVFMIIDPGLHLDLLGEVQKRVAEMLRPQGKG